jgi:hypothetical protein
VSTPHAIEPPFTCFPYTIPQLSTLAHTLRVSHKADHPNQDRCTLYKDNVSYYVDPESPYAREELKRQYPLPESQFSDKYSSTGMYGPPLSDEHKHNEHEHRTTTQPRISITLDDVDVVDKGWQETRITEWLVPHDAESQKRVWHRMLFGMTAKVNDKWGFSSTGVSREPSPSPSQGERQKAGAKN